MKKVFNSSFGYNSIIYIGNIYYFNKEEYTQLLMIHIDLIDISYWIRLLIRKYKEKKCIKKIRINYWKYFREISHGIIKIHQLKYL